MGFLKTFFASCLGTFTALFMLFSLFSIGISALVSTMITLNKNKTETAVKRNSVLQLSLHGHFTELEKSDPFEGIPGAEDFYAASVGLLQLKQAIAGAAEDKSIEGIYLDVSHFGGGFSQACEVRNALLRFRESKKWVIAYAESYTERGYYVASAADKIFLHPEGEVEFNGFAAEPMFLKGTLDKLEITPEVFRAGDFKSAVEPYLLNKMSDASRLQMREWLEDLYKAEIEDVAAAPSIKEAALKKFAGKKSITDTADALHARLVDTLSYYDGVVDDMRRRLRLLGKKDVALVKYKKYKNTARPYGSNEIAVIVADGDITGGKSTDGIIGSDDFAKEIRKAAENDEVKAIVLRINSPGGSALASDVIWREITLAKKEKPVIASMSDVAASGGYYMAMACDSIVADAATITGSIGGFGLMFDLSKFYWNKLGISFDEVKTGEAGDMYSPNRPLTALEKNIWQKRVNQIYETFTLKAAQGRGRTQDQIKEVAGGRVWSGSRAATKGLVDKIGSFDDAVAMAAHKAKIDSAYKISFYPKQKTFMEQIFDAADEKVTAWKENWSPQEAEIFRQLKMLRQRQGLQARLPFDLKYKP